MITLLIILAIAAVWTLGPLALRILWRWERRAMRFDVEADDQIWEGRR